MADTCDWPYGQTDLFQMKIYTLAANWSDVSGIYIFARQSDEGWYPIYVGQADSFKARLTKNHEHWDDAIRGGATHIHARSVSKQDERDRLEKELIHSLQPALNTQHR